MIKNKNIKRILVICMVTVILLHSFVACTQHENNQTIDLLDNTDGQITEDNQEKDCDDRIEHEYHISYKDIEFVSTETRELWREPLVKLLSNKAIPYGSGGEIIGYTYLFPDQPCIANGYQLGLYDFDIDAVPELIVNLGGGSAGNAYYYVYDIMTGELLGSLDGGFDKSWCTYFNLDTGKYEISWLYAYYEIDAAELELTQEEIDAGIHSSWDEIYTGVKFRVNGKESYIGAYFSGYDFFLENYIRIPETALLLVDWDDVCDYDEDQTNRAQKMTEALLSSRQQFINPNSSETN